MLKKENLIINHRCNHGRRFYHCASLCFRMTSKNNMKIIFATHNKGKLIELKNILHDFEIIGAEDTGVFEDVEEDGETFAENALKKARFVASRVKDVVIADDSGLCIKAFDGAPGIYSARWAGDRNIADFTLEKMLDIPESERRAWFETAAVLIYPDGREFTFTGKMVGKIATERRGEALPKLPYDTIFIPEGYTKTCAEMDAVEKNKISHRGRAFLEMREFLSKC